MFNHDLNKVKEYLDQIGAKYHIVNDWDFVQIYIFDKDAYEKQKQHPKKYRDLYVSYLRLSYHGGDKLYTRHDGICGNMSDSEIKKIIDELTGIEEGS